MLQLQFTRTELEHLLNNYLEVRKYILELHSIQESKLFIKCNGEPYIKHSTDYASFFIIMQDIVETQSAELFATKRILELLKKGVDISTIVKLSGKSINKCVELQKKNQSKDDANRKLLLALSDKEIEKKITESRKGYLKCPFCGSLAKATSENWVLVQLKENGEKHLACEVCKGASGKIIL